MFQVTTNFKLKSFRLKDEPVPEKGSVNLQNNPDLPSEQMQGNLPDTDPIEMPIDPETNLQD
ncbi:hypothetical protein BZZ01_01595 [Nostocales cyanobacterium HT-58-2]|nr:hypothetical protein BZZ01_01595 [Nostocales cyanobacterium HT-58-2]